jgi:hypothetical protein
VGNATYYDSGATRDSRENKPVFTQFLSHEVMRSFGAYMHANRTQADGVVRSGDNWKKGMPEQDYLDSLFRHFIDAWEAFEGGDRSKLEESLNGVLFNAMGLQYENLKVKQDDDTSFTVMPLKEVMDIESGESVQVEESNGVTYVNGMPMNTKSPLYKAVRKASRW